MSLDGGRVDRFAYDRKLIGKGDRITFYAGRGAQALEGTVVGGTYWRHMHDGTYTVFVPENGHLYSVGFYTGSVVLLAKAISSEAASALVEEARQQYAEHLKQYPIWAERIANGERVEF